MKRWIGKLFWGWAAWMPASVLAAGVATVQAGDRTLTVSYDGPAARVDIGGIAQGYLLLRDDTLYTVMQAGSRPLVMEGAAVAQLLGGRAVQFGPDMILALDKITPTGVRKTVAGRAGAVYTVSYQDTQGQARSGQAVLGAQPETQELSRVLGRLALSLQRAAAAGASSPGQGTADPAADGVRQVLDALESRRLGVLAYGTQFRVQTLTTEPPAPDILSLPAAPVQLPAGLGQLLQGWGAPARHP